MKRDFKRERWFKEFEQEAIKRDSELAGHICWDTATFLYNQGHDPKTAAKMVKRKASMR